MNQKTYDVESTDVKLTEYWVEWLFLFASFVTPLFVLFYYRDPGLFERSGSLMLFFAAVAEFVTVNRTNKKHILNACRAKALETPKDMSAAVKIVGGLSFVLALTGTIIWGYGSILCKI